MGVRNKRDGEIIEKLEYNLRVKSEALDKY